MSRGGFAMTDLVVSEDVGRVPGVLVDVGDSLSAGDLSHTEGRQSPSLVAALWVTNEVLPQLNQANARSHLLGGRCDPSASSGGDGRRRGGRHVCLTKMSD